MDRDHLHQIGITFQAHLRSVATGLGVLQLLLEVANQGCLTLQADTGGLQQIPQMHHVRQAPFAVQVQCLCIEHATGDGLVMQHAVQHGQETLGLPNRPPAMKLVDQRIPGLLILNQCFELRKRQTPQSRRQRRTNALG